MFPLPGLLFTEQDDVNNNPGKGGKAWNIIFIQSVEANGKALMAFSVE